MTNKNKALPWILLVILLVGLTAVLLRARTIAVPSQPAAVILTPVTVPINPVRAWSFDSGSPQTALVGGTTFGTGSSLNYKVRSDGPQGNYISVAEGHEGFTIGTMPATDTPFTAEFLYRPTNNRSADAIVFATPDDSFGVKATFQNNSGSPTEPALTFSAKVGGSVQTLKIDLNGTGPLSYAWWNEEFHLVDFVVGNGQMRVYVDGTLPPGFSKSVSGSAITGTGAAIRFNARGDGNTDFNYLMAREDIDAVSFYNSALPQNMAFQHYNDIFVNHTALSTTTSLTTAPDPEPTDAPRDMNQYLPGAILGTGEYTTYSSTPPTPLQQLMDSKLPKYKPGHDMTPIPNGNNLEYMAHNDATDFVGNVDNSPSGYRLDIAKKLNLDLAKNWNHYLYLGHIQSGNSGNNAGEIDNGLVNPQSYMYQFIQLANANPTLPTSTSTARAQTQRGVDTATQLVCANPWNGNTSILVSGPCIDYQGFPANHQLRNGTGSTGSAIGSRAGVPIQSQPIRRPVMDDYLTDYYPDGVRIGMGLGKLAAALTGRPATRAIDFNLEDGEEVALINKIAAETDPDVVAKRNSLGLTTFQYLGKDYANYENKSYVNHIVAKPGLQDMGYSVFRVDGSFQGETEDFLQFYYPEARKIMRATDGKFRAMPRVYPVKPSYILGSVAQYSGLKTAKDAAATQIANGDPYMMAATSNGWSPNEQNNVPPGNWLGVLENLVAMGSEAVVPFTFYISGNTTNLPASKMYINQLAAYAQAPFSYVESLYKNSHTIGNEPANYTIQPKSAWPDARKYPSMLTDSPQKQVVVRQNNNNSAEYIVQGTYVSYDDKVRIGAVPASGAARFQIGSQDIKIDVSPQGNLYYYNNTNPSAPVFYQIDSWHENKIPYRWSKDYAFEAEVVDGGAPTRITKGAGVATRDFSGGKYDTFISLPAGGTTTYTFNPRNSSGTTAPLTYYVWYKGSKSTLGGTATSQISLDGGTPITMSVTGDNTWCNKTNGSTITISAAQNQNHTLTFTSQDPGFLLDKITLATSASTNLGTCGVVVPPPNIVPSVTITSPSSGPSSSGVITNLSGTANDPDGTLTSVTWSNSVNGAVVGSGTATGTASWTIPTITLSPGDNVITIKATDNLGGEGIASFTVTYTVETTGPTIAVTAPSGAAALSGTVTVSATLTDASGIDHAEFYSKAGSELAVTIPGTITNAGSTYSVSWNTDTTATPNGAYTIYAKGYDTLGNMSTSGNVSVTINNVVVPPPDTTAPTASWSTPTQDATLTGAVTLTATATDPGTNPSGISSVKFLQKKSGVLSWTTIGTAIGSGSTYTYSFNTTELTDGTYTIRAEAYDGATPTHNMTFVERGIAINNSSLKPDMIVQDIQWTPSSPVQGQPITLKAVIRNNGTGATPAGIISGVRFTVNGAAVSLSDNYTSSIAPGATVTVTANTGDNSGTWSPLNGTYTIEAWVNDLNRYAELNTTNNKLTKSITVGVQPSISWVTPANNAHVIRGVEVPLTVLATSGVSKVSMYRNGFKTCTTTSGPSFTCLWTPSILSKAGVALTWEARAYDSADVQIDSKSITVIRD